MTEYLPVGTQVQCVSRYGTITGTVIAHAHARAMPLDPLVETTAGTIFRLDADTLTDRGGDQWERVLPTRNVYLNVYADGTVGKTEHNTFDEAAVRSQYGKTRVGILRQTKRGGAIVNAMMHPTTPRLRSASFPEGINPFS